MRKVRSNPSSVSYSEYGVIDEVEEMIEDIKELVKQEIRDCAEHVDDAVNCIDNL